MRAIRRIVVHHSAGRDDVTVEDVRREHRAKGWADVGYHYLVRRGPSGWTVESGRPLDQAGAHDQGQNADSIGVCLAGDYSRGPVPSAALVVLLGLLLELLERHGLDADQVEGHREHEPSATPTLCPGFEPARLRRLVEEAVGLTGPARERDRAAGWRA